MRLAAMALSVLLLLFGISQAGPALLPIQPLQNDNGFIMCTTFSVDEKRGYWMTAAHCLEEVMRIGGLGAEPLYVDPGEDVAVLQSTARAKAYRLGRNPGVGVEIRITGFPYGISVPITTSGTIVTRRIPLRGTVSDLYDITVGRGNSGSPALFNGEIVGMFIGWVSQDLTHVVGVPVETLRRVLKAARGPS